MFIAENTRNKYKLTIHDTAEQAVDYLLNSLNGDYENDFWKSECGKEIVYSEKFRLDFSLLVHNSLTDFVKSIEHLENCFKVKAFRQLADLLENLED